MPGHIGNLSHRSESFLAHCTHCKPSGLYWHCDAYRREFHSEYFLPVLLPSQLAESLFNHGLSSSYSLPFNYFMERTYLYLLRSLPLAYFVPRFQQILNFGTPRGDPFGLECSSSLDYQHFSPSFMGLGSLVLGR
jgi:hypothetical protein